MRRVVLVLGVALTVTCCVQTARADWQTFKYKWHSFWDRVHLDWHRNNAWPEPFQTVDRQATNMPLALMVDSGWKLQNTLTDELFDVETQELTRAGELKVREILTQYPPNRRDMYVLRGLNDQATDIRLRSVEGMVAGIVRPVDQRPTVLVSEILPRGGSGEYYDRVNRGFQSSQPPPRLPGELGGGSGDSN